MWRMVSTVCFVALAVSATAFGASNPPQVTISFMRLDLAGVTVATLRDCGPFGSETDVVEIKTTGPQGQEIIQKIPGRTRYPNVACTGVLTTSTTFADWREDIEQGKFATARKDGAFIFLDQAGQEVVRYNFSNAWPSKLMIHWEGSASTAPVTEEVEIVIESLTRP